MSARRLSQAIAEGDGISVLVENRFGVLSRVAGLFSARGYNIDPVQSYHDPELVDLLLAARRLLLDEPDYEGVVKGAVALGDDTDPTACIAGGLAGIMHGGIPTRWLEQMRGREILEPLLAALPE